VAVSHPPTYELFGSIRIIFQPYETSPGPYMPDQLAGAVVVNFVCGPVRCISTPSFNTNRTTPSALVTSLAGQRSGGKDGTVIPCAWAGPYLKHFPFRHRCRC